HCEMAFLEVSPIRNRYQQVREDLGWSRAQMAEKMGVDVTTLRNWEAGRRPLTLEKLIYMAELTGVTVQCLLGFDDMQANGALPLSNETLMVMHRMPVWIASCGWALVNQVDCTLVFTDLKTVPIEEVQEPIYGFPPAFACSLNGIGNPLTRTAIEQKETVWVEPITLDTKLRTELRGWYHLYGNRLVQNEFGHRFYLDTYGVQWLAFDSCFAPE
ncbi:MAG: helix-turn-helix domain-containing protein, partial [Oscillospiraceae bacterium]|nr:helix-turn-helix domain-containing protein [Oscillospiraceae bacterium]